jgi:hypothetical protein
MAGWARRKSLREGGGALGVHVGSIRSPDFCFASEIAFFMSRYCGSWGEVHGTVALLGEVFGILAWCGMYGILAWGEVDGILSWGEV